MDYICDVQALLPFLKGQMGEDCREIIIQTPSLCSAGESLSCGLIHRPPRLPVCLSRDANVTFAVALVRCNVQSKGTFSLNDADHEDTPYSNFQARAPFYGGTAYV